MLDNIINYFCSQTDECMGRHERSIKVAYNKTTNERVEADVLFEKYKSGYDIRKLVQTGDMQLACCECDQPLNVSTSSKDKLHFKHYPGHDPCILTSLSFEEADVFTQVHIAKESARHIQLKKLIGERLKAVEGVSDIAIDDRFIIKADGKRRPDVYCRYKDKEIVFEIQLSNLSLRYITNRYNFYKRNGIYLVWILDRFNVRNQGPMEKDIKYIAPHQNYFKLDEESDTFKLLCDYKQHRLTADNRLYTEWKRTSVSLDQIIFDSDFHAFYYDFTTHSALMTAEKEKRDLAIAAAEQERKIESAAARAKVIIHKIGQLKNIDFAHFDEVEVMIDHLDDTELSVLNEQLGFTKPNKIEAPVIRWIRATVPGNRAFLNFILGCEKVELNVNELASDGSTAFLEILKNGSIYKMNALMKLFKRGYSLTDADKTFIERDLQKDQTSDYAICLLFDRLRNRKLVDRAYNYSKQLLIIESAKQKRIVGFKFGDNWLAFGNNAAQHNKYWLLIETAFMFYRVWNFIIEKDHKNTFKNKRDKFYEQMPQQDDSIKPVIRDLYLELFEVI